MEFITQFHDFNQYHYDQCRKNVALIQYYLEGEGNSDIRHCYKRVILSMIEQHRVWIEEYASSNNIIYDRVELTWIDDLEAKIKQIHDDTTEEQN